MSVRHVVILRPDRGLLPYLLHEPARPLVCVCRRPQPERLDGMWWPLELHQCRLCGRKVLSEDLT